MNHIAAKGTASPCRSVGLGALAMIAFMGRSAVDQPSLTEEIQQAAGTQAVNDLAMG